MSCPRCGYDPEKEDREVEISWLVLALIIAMIVLLALAFLFGPKGGGGGLVNLTVDQDEGPTVLTRLEVLLITFAICFIAGLVAHLLERGRERCPHCGEILRLVRDVDKYHCIHCRTWFNREDIEIPEVDP